MYGIILVGIKNAVLVSNQLSIVPQMRFFFVHGVCVSVMCLCAVPLLLCTLVLYKVCVCVCVRLCVCCLGDQNNRDSHQSHFVFVKFQPKPKPMTVEMRTNHHHHRHHPLTTSCTCSFGFPSAWVSLALFFWEGAKVVGTRAAVLLRILFKLPTIFVSHVILAFSFKCGARVLCTLCCKMEPERKRESMINMMLFLFL